MMKIIDGKKYNTETATPVAEYEHSNVSDFGYYAETLYRKRTGEYFLHGEGGPASHYAVSVGNNSWSGGEKIIPLTIGAAKEWSEQNMDGDEYEREFGVVDEDEEKRAVTISITGIAHNNLKAIAQTRGISMSAVIEEFAACLFHTISRPAGMYVVSDPCYIMPRDEYVDMIKAKNCPIYMHNTGDSEIIVFHTRDGDGSHRTSSGRSLDVDTGLLSLIPVEYLRNRKISEECIEIVEFDSEFDMVFSRDNVMIGTFEVSLVAD